MLLAFSRHHSPKSTLMEFCDQDWLRQLVQTNSVETSDHSLDQVNSNHTTQTTENLSTNQVPAIELPEQVKTAENLMQAAPFKINNTAEQQIVSPQKTEKVVAMNEEQQIQHISNLQLSTNGKVVSNKNVKIKPVTKNVIDLTKPHPLSQSPGVNKDLFTLQNSSWVIQIGSYKEKDNALRIVNQLRAKGYKAFIQEVSTPVGDSTRVFVGPESKQHAARQLATQIENNMQLRGIVISYKPLAL